MSKAKWTALDRHKLFQTSHINTWFVFRQMTGSATTVTFSNDHPSYRKSRRLQIPYFHLHLLSLKEVKVCHISVTIPVTFDTFGVGCKCFKELSDVWRQSFQKWKSIPIPQLSLSTCSTVHEKHYIMACGWMCTTLGNC